MEKEKIREEARATVERVLTNTPRQISTELYVRAVAMAVFEAAFQAGYDCHPWQRVEDGEPDDSSLDYLVTVDDDSVDEATVFAAKWDGERFVTSDVYRAEIGTVTAYMPLPPPYTEQEGA